MRRADEREFTNHNNQYRKHQKASSLYMALL